MQSVEKEALYDSVKSWYAASVNNNLMGYNRLESGLSCDVCIIGGGFTGVSAALELRKKGFDVVLIEAKKIGWEGTGRNGGHVQRGYIHGPQVLTEKFSFNASKLMCDLSVEGVRLIRDRIKEHSIDCDWQTGHLTVTRSPTSGIKALESEAREWRDIGYDDFRIIGRDETRQFVKSDLYHGGMYDPEAGHFHPLNYVLGLARAAQNLGVKIYENTPAEAIEKGQPNKVKTAYGDITARYVLIACGASIGLNKTLARRIITATTYLIATEPLGDLGRQLLPRNTPVVDNRFIMDYFRLSSDQRLLFGGTCNYSAITLPGQQEKLRKNMIAVFPELTHKSIDYFWGGTIDIPINRLPDIGRFDSIYYAQGFAGHGIVLGNMAGKVVADAISGDAKNFDVFGKINHLPFPGGPWLRRPAFVLGMMWYRLRDYLS